MSDSIGEFHKKILEEISLYDEGYIDLYSVAGICRQADSKIAEQQMVIKQLKEKNESLRMLFIDFKATMRTVKNTSESMLAQAAEFERLLGENNG